MIVSRGVIENLSGLICFGSFAILIIQGLRNRAARWVAIVGLSALGLTVKYQYWYTSSCYSKPEKVLYFIWIATISTMALHQIIQRPTTVSLKA